MLLFLKSEDKEAENKSNISHNTSIFAPLTIAELFHAKPKSLKINLIQENKMFPLSEGSLSNSLVLLPLVQLLSLSGYTTFTIR